MHVSKEHIVRRSLADPRPKADWTRFDATTDEEIARQIANNPDTAPLIDESWLESARIVEPEGKVPVTIRLDRDVVSFFKETGSGYQTRMNAVLRAYMEHARKQG